MKLENYIKNNFNVKDHLKGLSVEEINFSQPKFPYALGGVNIGYSSNLGNMIRTATVFAAANFFIIGNKKYDKRGAVGAHNYMDIVKIDPKNFTELSVHLGDYNFFPIFMEITPTSIPFTKELCLDICETFTEGPWPCFIFGSEADGFPKELLGSYCCHIPQYGVLRCLNVATVCSIVAQKYSETLVEFNDGF